MIEYGKIKNVKTKDNTVYIEFETVNMEVYLVTEWTVRFFVQLEKEQVISKAVEQIDNAQIFLQVEQYSDCINIQTEKLIVKIYDGGFVDIYDKNGTVLCLDYRGEQNLVQTVDIETKDRKSVV